MKTVIKSLMIFTLLGMFAQAQVYVQEPDPPPALAWGSQDLSEQQEQEYLAKIKNEQLKRELQQIKNLNEKKYFSLLRKTSFMSFPSIYSIGGSGLSVVGHDDDESKLRQEIAELELYTEVLGVKYQEASGENKQKLAEQLRENLSRVFDMRENQRKEEIEKLEKKLAELKESIKIRKDNKQQIVDERFRTLTGKSKYLKWD